MYKMEFYDDDFSDLIVIDNDEIDTYNKTYKLEMRHNYVECYRTYLGDETYKFRTFIKSDSVSNSITTDYETKIGDYLEKIDFWFLAEWYFIKIFRCNGVFTGT